MPHKIMHCTGCQGAISQKKFKKNKGICDRCKDRKELAHEMTQLFTTANLIEEKKKQKRR